MAYELWNFIWLILSWNKLLIDFFANWPQKQPSSRCLQLLTVQYYSLLQHKVLFTGRWNLHIMLQKLKTKNIRIVLMLY